jgi:hypothetical protein
VLDFVGLADRYVEKDLEDAVLRELETFLLELGAGFTFLARQKRIQLEGEDFYLDLLFYNRRLRRLVAVELKLGRFKAAYKGQMELYLRWLDKHEREQNELPPLGIPSASRDDCRRRPPCPRSSASTYPRPNPRRPPMTRRRHPRYSLIPRTWCLILIDTFRSSGRKETNQRRS